MRQLLLRQLRLLAFASMHLVPHQCSGSMTYTFSRKEGITRHLLPIFVFLSTHLRTTGFQKHCVLPIKTNQLKASTLIIFSKPFPSPMISLDDHAKHPIWLPDTQSSSQAAAATVAAAEASATTGSSKTHFDQFRRRGGEALLAYQSNECMRGHTVSTTRCHLQFCREIINVHV